jgi:hypothetical protein
VVATPRREDGHALLDAAIVGFGGRDEVRDWAGAAHARLLLAPAPVWLGRRPRSRHRGGPARAIARVRPAGIDVASGAEDGVPGHKSRARIAALRSICDTVCDTVSP